MKFFLPDYIEFIISSLEKNGFEAYIVGGCVRDILLGIAPHDYDITTSAKTEDIKRIFKKTVDTGIKHGTVTVIESGVPVEVTTFRTEGSYSDSRRPDGVKFVTDVKEDLSRRDFTVNALCYNPDRGLIDCFSGSDDIKNRILRAVGNPDIRFSEDALRIMRLFRFAATLKFEIEQDTLKLALKNSKGLEKISRERIAAELLKLCLGERLDLALPLFESGALGFLKLSGGFNANAISALKKNAELRLFAILNECSSDLKETLELLKYSNKIKEYVLSLSELTALPISQSRADIKRNLSRFGREIFSDYLNFLSAVRNIDTTDLKAELSDILERGEPYKISHLNISGNDLLSLGISGEEIGKRLELLLKEVILNPECNKRDILRLKIIEPVTPDK